MIDLVCRAIPLNDGANIVILVGLTKLLSEIFVCEVKSI